MTPLPPPLGSGGLTGWRLDLPRHAATWDNGEGAYLVGGRWNSAGVRAVYAALDPATSILEVAVHKGMRTLDTVAHVLTSFEMLDPAAVHVVQPGDLPNPNWLRPGLPSAGQAAFGDDLLARHGMFIAPSVVSTHSWNVVFQPRTGAGRYRLRGQEPFALDTRLHPRIP